MLALVFAGASILAPAAAGATSTTAGVEAFGDAPFYGSTASSALRAPVVGMAATASGRGYWLVASDGGVFSFGDAQFRGSTGALRLNRPIVGMAATASGRGYWLVASDGGIFSFGDAQFRGSTGALRLNRPIVGMAATASGRGYWLVASDGGIFSFGDAQFRGSTGALRLNRPIVGMAATASGRGYWLVASDGGIFSFGDARFLGSTAGADGDGTVAMAASPSGAGYWLATDRGAVHGYGDARQQRARSGRPFPASEMAVDVVSDRTGDGYWIATRADPRAEAAIAWFEARLGWAAYREQCELAVENAFGTDSQYPTAAADWAARPDRHSDWQDAPRGALVFYATSSAGHVAISTGDGDVVSSDVNGRIAKVPIAYFQNPLGWAASPF